MAKAVFTGRIEGGRMPLYMREQIKKVVEAFEGKALRVTLQEAKKIRSLNQNAFYMGVVVPHVVGMFLAEGDTISHEEAHKFLKTEIGKLGRFVTAPDGKEYWIEGTTTDYSTREWEDYIEKIRAWAAQFGYEIPFPNEELRKA